MAIKYTEKEIKALDQKEANPTEVVICPRCGKPLQYFDFVNGYQIKCETKECLSLTVRGI